MIFPENIEVKLGFDKIRTLVRENCLSSLGKDLVNDMSFVSDSDLIGQLVNQTNEFVRILQEEDDFPVSYYFDLRQPLHRIGVVGTFLEEKELWDLRRTMDTIGQVVSFFKQKEESDYPFLKELATDVFTFPDLIRLIDRVVDPLGQIKDSASPALAEIRANIAATENSISRSLNAILRQAKSDGIIDSDVSPSIRDGRLVIPVPPANKRRIRGIVHDESATGKTVFIEPEAVVEANNRIRELQADEKREIIRILTDLTNQIRPRVPELEFSLAFLAEIDFIRAKARFATETNSVLPQMVNGSEIEWFNAVHPLLFLSHQRQGKPVVPLTIKLDAQDRILLISGPNAGGKSVCLKTVGLLTYMFQCGMLVPMNDNSRIGIFNDLFIDIGDEQSIENDLSTYSSHMANMKTVVRNCNGRSLILIDEFGSGTEPQIGGALAVALLHNFNDQKSFGVITTHYNSLKNFATETDGIINGAMLYDRHIMQPLFKLEIGNPGSSFAVDIARKMGLPESIIKEAEEIVGTDYVNMDKYLQDIVRDKRYWENKRQNIRIKSKHIEEVEAKYAAELEDLSAQRKSLIKQSKEEAKMILSQANAVIENTVRQIKEAQAEKEKTREARKQVEDFKTQLEDEKSAAIDRKIAQLREREERKKQRKEQQGQAQPVTVAKPVVKPLVVGDAVRVKGQQKAGTLLSLNGNNALVQYGPMKMNVKADTLESVSNSQIKKENRQQQNQQRSNVVDKMRHKSLNFKREIDLRGMRGDEALAAVQLFIDDALMVGVSEVRILHGTGTGILRQLIRDYLATVPGVEHYHDEHVQLGGAGITVVEF
ncbi:MAG: endonuclease MutS2 [Paludibacteraceae bacterium]|nr:endonuclease MutS2 [Paludibacteraceae bacterium]